MPISQNHDQPHPLPSLCSFITLPKSLLLRPQPIPLQPLLLQPRHLLGVNLPRPPPKPVPDKQKPHSDRNDGQHQHRNPNRDACNDRPRDVARLRDSCASSKEERCWAHERMRCRGMLFWRVVGCVWSDGIVHDNMSRLSRSGSSFVQLPPFPPSRCIQENPSPTALAQAKHRQLLPKRQQARSLNPKTPDAARTDHPLCQPPSSWRTEHVKSSSSSLKCTKIFWYVYRVISRSFPLFPPPLTT